MTMMMMRLKAEFNYNENNEIINTISSMTLLNATVGVDVTIVDIIQVANHNNSKTSSSANVERRLRCFFAGR